LKLSAAQKNRTVRSKHDYAHIGASCDTLESHGQLSIVRSSNALNTRLDAGAP